MNSNETNNVTDAEAQPPKISLVFVATRRDECALEFKNFPGDPIVFFECRHGRPTREILLEVTPDDWRAYSEQVKAQLKAGLNPLAELLP